MPSPSSSAIRKRRQRDRERNGIRVLRGLELEIAPGVIVRELEIHSDDAEQWLLETRRITHAELDHENLVDEAVKAAIVTP
ncbi:MAG: hypothetical protein H5U13_11490 [Parvibaculum sp.]|nr:hypothetical protein [Parvibaculum sp.]